MVVISREHTTAPADTPSPLEEPSPDEVAAASNAGVYVPGSGPTEVTATRSYVSLRIVNLPTSACDGPEGWAYVTGSADGPGVHYGLLGDADELVLSALDDRLFVASPASLSQDPPSAPAAWLIDSVTGQRGAAAVGGPTDRDGLCRAGVGAVSRPTRSRSTPIPANGSCPVSSIGATGRSGR